MIPNLHALDESCRSNKDDIFSGLFSKRIVDHLGYTVSHGLSITALESSLGI